MACNSYDGVLQSYIITYGDTFYSPEFRKKVRENYAFLEYGSYFKKGDQIPNITLDITGENSRKLFNIKKFKYNKKKRLYQESDSRGVQSAMREIGLTRQKLLPSFTPPGCDSVTAEDLLNHNFFSNSIVIFSLCIPTVSDASYGREIERILNS